MIKPSASILLLLISIDVHALDMACTTEEKSSTYYQKDKGYLGAIALHNQLLDLSDTNRFDASVTEWRLAPGRSAFVTVSSKDKQCAGEKNATKFDCQVVGCNEPIPGTEGYGVGAQLSVSSCGPNTSGSYTYTTLLWVKQSNGSWTLTSRTSELRVSCDPT